MQIESGHPKEDISLPHADIDTKYMITEIFEIFRNVKNDLDKLKTCYLNAESPTLFRVKQRDFIFLA